MLTVARNVIFRLSRLKDDRLNVTTVSGGVGVALGEIEIFERILMLFVLNVERQQLFRSNLFKANPFFAEIVLVRIKKLLNEFRLTE